MADPAEALGLRRGTSDDYRLPPSVRWSQPWSGRTVTVLTVVGALLVGFLLSVGLRAGRDVAREQDLRRIELISLIDARQEHVEALSVQLEALRTRVQSAEAQAVEGVPALRGRLQEMERAAGMTRVAGPGLRVTFGDASGTCPTGRSEDCRIQDTDLQLAVNLLFSLGAEAVAVNGERVIATTAIRGAGRAVLVNYRVLTAPYVVESIGDRELLHDGFMAAQLAQDFLVWKDVYGLGFSVERHDRLELPAFTGALRLRSAPVVGEGGS